VHLLLNRPDLARSDAPDSPSRGQRKDEFGRDDWRRHSGERRIVDGFLVNSPRAASSVSLSAVSGGVAHGRNDRLIQLAGSAELSTPTQMH
jgi:hypothetical protein